MNKKIVSLVKYNKTLLKVYRFVGNLGIGVLRCFVKTNDKLILYMAYGGQKYDDSPKAIYEEMKREPFFDQFKVVWAFTNPEKQPDIGCEKIKTDTIRFYVTALAAKIWVHNSSMERGLRLKNRGTIEINTNHGTPLKYFGSDVKDAAYSSKSSDTSGIIHCAQSEYEKNIYIRCTNANPDTYLLCGLPRNDSINMYTYDECAAIRRKLNIPANKKIMLYAPTFREYERDAANACVLRPPLDLNKWRSVFGMEYVLLIRAHYEVIHILNIECNDFVYDVSNYPALNDLIAISDLLITDYSSIMFDYSITDKPIFNFSYDYEEYLEKRGLYLDLMKEFPGRINKTEDTLIEEIQNYNPEDRKEKTKEFHTKYATYSGSASKEMVRYIKQML